jgi:SNF2 family DNA or RNA helicase
MGYSFSRKPIPYVAELYQEVATQHLLENDHAALFAGCGLGKTASTLDAINQLFNDFATIGVLVVAPLRVANLTWKNEVQKWKQFSWMKVVNLRSKEGIMAFRRREGHIYVINYEQLPKFCFQELRRFRKLRQDFPFDTIVWDELSKAKKHKSVRIDAMRKYWPFIDRHWGLTGTPQPNSKLDLFAQYRLLDNGERLGRNFYEFRHRYFFSTDEHERKWAIRKRDSMRLEEKVADMTLVLKSADYLDIPDTTIEDMDIILPKEAKVHYKKLEKELFLKIKQSRVEALNSAVLLNKLIQVTSGSIYGTEKEVIELHEAKLDALRKIYQDMDTPLMVAFQYKHEEERILRALPGSIAFSAAKSHEKQDRLVDKWNRGEIPALVVHPMSVGHGLNLQGGGHTICWVSLGWSRELYDQLNARLARKGQKFPTKVIRLLVKGSVDYAVAEALHEKGDNQQALFDTIENLRMLGRL